MGGYGTWDLAMAAPERFAAIVPAAGGGTVNDAKRIAKFCSVWAFHGARDDPVPLEASKKMVEAIRTEGGDARMTVYEDRGHDVCNLTFFRDDVYDWLLKQRRGK
jgi:predicted peptidase